MDKRSDPLDWRFYGRRAGRRLTLVRKENLERIYPRYQIPIETLNTGAPHTLHPSSLFDESYKRYCLEIGFGNGERLAQHLSEEPDTGFLGAEPFVNGMAAFLGMLPENPVPQNLRVLMDDAMRLVRRLAPQSLDALYILNPDPWHKKRHHKRRLINPDNLDLFAHILKPDGLLVTTTDVEDLANWTITHCVRYPAFEWLAQQAEDWRLPPQNWIHTQYETKGAKGAHKMNYFLFRRKNL